MGVKLYSDHGALVFAGTKYIHSLFRWDPCLQAISPVIGYAV